MTSVVRIGILCDLTDQAPDPSGIERWLRIAIDEVAAAGRIDHPVEFISAFGHGLPTGSADAVEQAFTELVDQDVSLIVGPAIGDNALIATPLVEAAGVPAINWAGAERARGDWMFHLQVGSHEEESILLARHLKASGTSKVGIVYDTSPIGDRHLEFFRYEAGILGLEIGVETGIEPTAEDAESHAHAVMAAECDAICYLGLGLALPPLSEALLQMSWTGMQVMNTCGLRGYAGEFRAACNRWTYVDMHSDGNGELLQLCVRHDLLSNERLAAAKGYDLGRLVAEGIARAPEPTRAGIRTGLERTKWLPAAQGEEGTLLGFGIQDRGALHGRYLVLRRWQDGRTIEA